MSEKRIIISSISSLKKYYGFGNIMNYPLDVELSIHGLTTTENDRFLQIIKDYASECGCETGQMFIKYFVFSSILFWMFSVYFPTKNGFVNLILFALIGAAFGKLLGHIRARINLNKTIKEIEKKVIIINGKNQIS